MKNEWQWRRKPIDPSRYGCAGIVYVLGGYCPFNGRFVCYIGSTTNLKKANSYWGSGSLLRKFPQREQWMERHVVEWVEGTAEDVLEAEYLQQLKFRDEIIYDNHYLDSEEGEWLNLQIVSPYQGDECWHHHSIVRPEGLGGAKSPVMVQYCWNRSPVYYASQKDLCEKYGWGNGTICNWFLLKGSTAGRKIYAADDCSPELRKRNPKKTWNEHGIEYIRYATETEIKEYGE